MQPQYNHDGSALRIWKEPQQNGFLTTQAGRPVFDEVTFVEVTSPGSAGSCPVFEVRREFHTDYAKSFNEGKPLYGPHWERFEKYVTDFDENDSDVSGALSGTPLKEWREMVRTDVAALAVQGIYTVEAVAHLPDAKLNLLGPNGRELQAKALAYLAAASDAGTSTALAAENETLKADIVRLEREKGELSTQITALQGQLAAAQSGIAPSAPDSTAQAEQIDPLAIGKPKTKPAAPASIV